ncbi:MAG: response regulator, partial [Planococcus sp. (in: firmicutes)]
MIQVLLVDDHAILRDGLKTLIAQEEDMEVIGEATGSTQLIDMLPKVAPDIIMM